MHYDYETITTVILANGRTWPLHREATTYLRPADIGTIDSLARTVSPLLFLITNAERFGLWWGIAAILRLAIFAESVFIIVYNIYFPLLAANNQTMHTRTYTEEPLQT
jgi:hypothetical protein